MYSEVIHIVSLTLIFNSVIVFANNTSEISQTPAKNVTDQQIFFAEGGINIAEAVPSHSSKSRIKGRKGADPNETPLPVDGSSSIEKESSVPSSTSINITSNVTVATNYTLAPIPSSSTTSTTSTTTPNPTTKKVVKKPKITMSADDNSDIRDSEKNINYNTTTRIEDVVTPKTASDVDRTMLEEKRTRRNYMIYMGLAFSLPVAFTLIHVMYKKIRNWMEIRHYQRVVS